LNYGLAWSFESTLVNNDLPKPKYLAPLYGSDLTPTNNNKRNFSPSIGFAWQVDGGGKTVVRAGSGIYYDTELLWRRLQERAYTGPIGNGRVQYPAGGLINTLPGIVNISRGGIPVAVGAPVPSGELTNMTTAQFIGLMNAQIGAVAAALAPKNLNDLSVRNIDISKAGAQLYPKDYPVQKGLHMNIGVQRQVRNDMVLSVDFVRRVFVNTLLGEVDYNRWERYIGGQRSPVIPVCTGSQASTPGFGCSTGPISFWTPGGREVYNAALVKFDKRFADRYQFTASYALTNQHGYNGLINLNQWNASWGPKGARHILNVSGLVELPWGVQLGVIASSSSRGPINVSVSSGDINGDGTTSELLPGLGINCLNRGCGRSDLETAVSNWNSNIAGKTDARGKVIQRIVLPGSYQLGDNFNSQDVRVTKLFKFGREPHEFRLSVFGEAFNVFNIANLGGYSFTVDNVQPVQTFAFGQPTSRAGQVFGSGGPRAFQVGARIQF
jgi:hypothetical protein